MTGLVIPILADFSLARDPGGQVLLVVLCTPTIISVVAICAGAWSKVHKYRLETSLKQQMIDRGMSADDIVTVLTRSKLAEPGVEAPCACEVVVENGGEWQTGLVLKRDGERYYIHFVGTDMSSNEWVNSDRIRFAVSRPSESQYGDPWDGSVPVGAYSVGNGLHRSNHVKPEPVDQEF